MKQLTIPFVPYTATNLDQLGSILEDKGKRISIDTLNWIEEFPYAPSCLAYIGYNDDGILLHYKVSGRSIRALSPGDGNYVHEDSCVEFFMQKEQGESYINFEFNAAGVCYAAHHRTITDSTLLTADEFASIKRLATYQGERFAEKLGEYSWTISVLIPWTTMGYTDNQLPKSLRGNFYKCADGTADPHYLSWAPIDEPKPAFHRPQFFGELVLAPRP